MASAARVRMLAVAALALLLAVGVAGPAMAQGGGSGATIDVRVWQNVDDERDLYVSARPAGGSWRTLGTVPLALDGLTASGSYRYGDIALAVPEAVDIRIWQNVAQGWRFLVSARPAGGSWPGRAPLLPDDGSSASGRYRYGDITLALSPSVTTLAGRAGKHGYADGLADGALFGEAPQVALAHARGLGLAIDGEGNVIVADSGNHAIRRIAPDGTVTTIAGGNGRGLRDGPAATAQFAGPMGVAIAPDGSIYVADSYSHRIRRIADGVVTTVAGSGPAFTWPVGDDDSWGGHRDGPAEKARLEFPRGIAFAPDGGLLIIERQGRIRRLSSIGWVSTLAEDNTQTQRDGALRDASFGVLRAIDTDAEGNAYVIDDLSGATPGAAIAIRKIDAQGVVSTIFRGAPAGAGGVLSIPSDLAVTEDGAIYIANTGRHQILELRDGELHGVAGTGQEGYANGDRDEATFSLPVALAVAADGALVVGDDGNGLVRRIAPAGDGSRAGFPAVARAEWLSATVERFAGRPGEVYGLRDGPAVSAQFFGIQGMALDASGNVIVADCWNHAIRRIAPDGVVTTIAGGNGEGVRDGPGEHAQFAGPKGVAVHADGSIYVADSAGNRIRRIAPDGMVTTVAGGGPMIRGCLLLPWAGNTGSFRDGPAADARFHGPGAIAFDRAGNLLIADVGNHLLRVLTPAGLVSTLSGISGIRGIAVGEGGSIFVTGGFDPIHEVAPDGTVSPLLRTPRPGRGGRLLSFIEGIAVGSDGALYVVDPGYDRVARIDRDGSLAFIAGGREGDPTGFMAVLPLDDGTLLASGHGAIWRITFEAE